MRLLHSALLLLLTGWLCLPGSLYAQPAAAEASFEATGADRIAVRQAALDYVEALYEADTTRIVRSVDPALVKYGYVRRSGTYRGTAMSYDQLLALTHRWNRDGERVDPETAVKAVEVFDILDRTAAAKVTAHWGSDYLHLVKDDGRWLIRQILWQTPAVDE